MKAIFIRLILWALFPSLVWAQNTPDSIQALQIDVVYLASDFLEGREPGTRGEALAAQYISYRFEEMGLAPLGLEGSWYQPFTFKFHANPHESEENKDKLSGKNVLGYLDNGAAYTVVIGAHYDHLGYGGFGSRSVGKLAIHNGADDNASGIAIMLDLANRLSKASFSQHNYLFLAFSAEEWGLVGSKHFVNHPLLSLEKISCMINLDMVGRLNEKKVLAVNGVGTSPDWKPLLEELDIAGIQLKMSESGIGPSDHTSFYLKDIPVLHFFTGQHTDYHKPQDDSHLVNFQGMGEISFLIYSLLEKLDPMDTLEFSSTKDESQSRTAASFKVTLGVMPDYVSEEEGMQIDAVMEGRPAEQAGIQDGDLVIQIGEYKVTDIYSYMEALSKFKKGDKAMVKVRRGEEEREYEVEF